MFMDARSLDTNASLSADLAIIGAGPAGITIAHELIARGLSVLLIDCGTFEAPEPWAEDAAKWREDGIRDIEIHRCNRRVGGSTWYWGSNARPFEPIDFEVRDWVPYSGWPISYDEIVPFYDRTLDLLELRARPGETVQWDARDIDPSTTYDWPEVQFPLNRFGAVEFSQRAANMRTLPGVTILTAATLKDIRLSGDLSRVDHVICTVPGGNTIRVDASRFVLAAGGVETPAILLRANSQMKEGIGNQHDLVGRFLQSHPTYDCQFRFMADFPLAKAMQIDWGMVLTPNIHARREVLRGYSFAKIALAESVQRENKLLNCAAALCGFKNTDPSQIWRDLETFIAKKGEGMDDAAAEQLLLSFTTRPAELLRAFKMVRSGNITRDYFFNLQFASEQSPHPDSRVTLTGERDALGNLRPAVDWRLCDLDRRSMKRTAELVGLAHETRGLAEDFLVEPVGDSSWPRAIHGGFHYIGTTRMGDDPRTSVVDRDCKVHGIENLYISGCSVFPTSGHSPPTFTMVALSARLAQHFLNPARPAKDNRLVEAKPPVPVGANGHA